MSTHNLEFNHFIIDRQGVIFASARDKNNIVYNFIINSQTGTVLKQINNQFKLANDPEQIKQRAEAYYGKVAVYQIQQPLGNLWNIYK